MKSPAGEAKPLTDEQIDALMPEPCDSIAEADGFNVIGAQDVWTRDQVRAVFRAALATYPAPSASAPAQPTEPAREGVLGTCKVCNGDPPFIPCAYPWEKPAGCPRLKAAPAQPVVPTDVVKIAQAFVANGYRGPLHWAAQVFDWVAAAPSAALVAQPEQPLGDAGLPRAIPDAGCSLARHDEARRAARQGELR